MSFYIIDKNFKDVIEIGFATKEDAQDYIWHHSYMGQYHWHYDVKEWTEDIAYGVTCTRDSLENGGTTFWIFETWDEAIAYACDYPYEMLEDFDFEDDIYQIDMTAKEK